MDQKITALRTQKRNSQRVNVHLDGKFAFGLNRVVAGWLQVGDELNQEKIKELQDKDAAEIAYQRAVNFLSYRPRSETEVIGNLRKHKTPDEQIEKVIDRLKRSNLVNDEEFARLWVDNRSDFRPRGGYALRMELLRKGLSEDIIAAAIENINESELAYQAALKRSRTLVNLEWKDFRKKLSGFLSRRGFNYETTSLTVKKVWEEEQHNKLQSDLQANEV
ncbi:MAG: hypothetical protein FVQ83_01030 [Chloroflexi bacterium]|nr:hypothetical protein [Chloroflexota bacterium]